MEKRTKTGSYPLTEPTFDLLINLLRNHVNYAVVYIFFMFLTEHVQVRQISTMDSDKKQIP